MYFLLFFVVLFVCMIPQFFEEGDFLDGVIGTLLFFSVLAFPVNLIALTIAGWSWMPVLLTNLAIFGFTLLVWQAKLDDWGSRPTRSAIPDADGRIEPAPVWRSTGDGIATASTPRKRSFLNSNPFFREPSSKPMPSVAEAATISPDPATSSVPSPLEVVPVAKAPEMVPAPAAPGIVPVAPTEHTGKPTVDPNSTDEIRRVWRERRAQVEGRSV